MSEVVALYIFLSVCAICAAGVVSCYITNCLRRSDPK